MTTRDWNRIRELFNRALERAPEERLDFFRQLCADEPWPAGEAAALLTTGSGPTVPRMSAVARTGALRHSTPMTFNADLGRYRILKAVGHTGSGTVYLAKPFEHELGDYVLIRMIRPERMRLDLPTGVAEHCRMLSAFDHPNIVKVLDGGTTESGFPYIVTEYLNGEPLDRYCDRLALPVPERLRLFLTVCSAVRYAHERSFLYRGLTPENILVTGQGIAKLLGVGIASQLGPRSAWPPCAEAAGTPAVTSEYTSPEQAAGRPATIASDVYALGAILYELLSGHRPFYASRLSADDSGSVPETRRPEPPSRLLTRRAVLEVKNVSVLVTPERVCRSRSCTPRDLMSQIQGNLDSIAIKALEGDPGERYESVARLAEDITDHLRGALHRRVPGALFSRFTRRLARGRL